MNAPLEEEGIRLARRRVLASDVVLHDLEGHGTVTLPALDVSVTGLLVEAPLSVSVGSEFLFELEVDGAPVRARGRIARITDEHTSRVGLGVQFVELAREARERLLAFTTPPALRV